MFNFLIMYILTGIKCCKYNICIAIRTLIFCFTRINLINLVFPRRLTHYTVVTLLCALLDINKSVKFSLPAFKLFLFILCLICGKCCLQFLLIFFIQATAENLTNHIFFSLIKLAHC